MPEQSCRTCKWRVTPEGSPEHLLYCTVPLPRWVKGQSANMVLAEHNLNCKCYQPAE